VNAQRGLWEIHYDPYDLTQVFVRTTDGWINAPWTHLPMVCAPFAEFTWRHARTLTAQRGGEDTNETEVARVLDDLLTRAEAGPVDKRTDRVTARGRVAATSHRPPPGSASEQPALPAISPAEKGEQERMATVIPFGIFDADAEADRW
jgi:hypothetical protein